MPGSQTAVVKDFTIKRNILKQALEFFSESVACHTFVTLRAGHATPNREEIDEMAAPTQPPGYFCH